MTDRKPDALVSSSRPGALEKTPTGDLMVRGLADLKLLEKATPGAEECYERGRRLNGEGNDAEAGCGLCGSLTS